MPSAKRAAKALGGGAPKPKAKAATPRQKPAPTPPPQRQAPAKTFEDSVAEADEYWKRLEAMGLIQEGVDANKARQALLRDVLERNQVEMPDWVKQRGEVPPAGPSQAELMAGAAPAPRPKPAPTMPDPYEAMGKFGVGNKKPDMPTPEPKAEYGFSGMYDKISSGLNAVDKGLASAPSYALPAAKRMLRYGVPAAGAYYGGTAALNWARARSAEMNRPEDPYSVGEPAPHQARGPMTEEQTAEARARVLARLRGQQ